MFYNSIRFFLSFAFLFFSPFFLQAADLEKKNEEKWFYKWESLLSDFQRKSIEDLIDYQKLHFVFKGSNINEFERNIKIYKKKYPTSPLTKSLNKYQIFFDYKKFGIEKISLDKYSSNDLLFLIDFTSDLSTENKIALFERMILQKGKASLLLPIVNPLSKLYKKLYKKINYVPDFLKANKKNNFYETYAWLLFKNKHYRDSQALFTYLDQKKQKDHYLYYMGYNHYKLRKYTQSVLLYETLISKIRQKKTNEVITSYMYHNACYYYVKALRRNEEHHKAFFFLEDIIYSMKIELESFYREYLSLSKKYYKERFPSILIKFLKAYPKSKTAYRYSRLKGIEHLMKGDLINSFFYFDRAYGGSREKDLLFIKNYFSSPSNMNGFYETNKSPFYDHFLISELINRNEKLNFFYQKKLSNDSLIISNLLKGNQTALNNIRFSLHQDNLESYKKKYWVKRDFFLKKYLSKETGNENYFFRVYGFSAFGLHKEILNELKKKYKPYSYEMFVYEKVLRNINKTSYRNIKKSIIKMLSYKEEVHLFPNEFLTKGYPLYRYTYISYLSELYQVPVSLIYAIIREESHFQPRALSFAGAKGLMQIIPSTAKYLMKKSGLKKYYALDLYNEELNLHLGVYYLSNLLKRFKGNYYHVVASYNAGESAINHWLKEDKRSDNVIFSLTIPYHETDKYVKRVMSTYYIYKNLYFF